MYYLYGWNTTIYVLPIWLEHNYICINYMVGTQLYMYFLYGWNTTIYFHTDWYNECTRKCFGPVYWPSSSCTVNLTSSYTICAWGTLGGGGGEISSYVSGWHGHVCVCVCVGHCSVV
jgi:hypothetical protein